MAAIQQTPQVAVTLTEEQAVMDALADDHFDFRSLQGLSEATGIDPERVLTILEKKSDEIRVS